MVNGEWWMFYFTQRAQRKRKDAKCLSRGSCVMNNKLTPSQAGIFFEAAKYWGPGIGCEGCCKEDSSGEKSEWWIVSGECFISRKERKENAKMQSVWAGGVSFVMNNKLTPSQAGIFFEAAEYWGPDIGCEGHRKEDPWAPKNHYKILWRLASVSRLWRDKLWLRYSFAKAVPLALTILISQYDSSANRAPCSGL
jgi:hypothetical protein